MNFLAHLSIAGAIGVCGATAAGCALIAFTIQGKDRSHPPKVIYWTAETRSGFSVMEEEVTEQYALVWYHGGWPTFEWRRRHP